MLTHDNIIKKTVRNDCFFCFIEIFILYEYNVNMMNDKSKNAKRLNFHKGRQPRNPSQTNGTANVRINSEIAIPKLQELAHRYIGIIDAKGFLDDLRIALGIPNAKRVSKYGEIVVPKDDGSILKASLRITNHQANAGQHIKNNANYDYNLSIVVRRRARKNTFIPHNDVKLDEYVYYGKNISKVENPLTQIINSIIGFLQTGVYKDTTGVALKNTSPTNENKEYKTNKNMAKNKIRITENELKQIVNESVKKVLNENTDENYEIKRLLTNLYGWTQFYEEEFDKANISDRSGSRYSMWGALREMQNIIGQLYDLCLKSNPRDRAL